MQFAVEDITSDEVGARLAVFTPLTDSVRDLIDAITAPMLSIDHGAAGVHGEASVSEGVVIIPAAEVAGR